MMPRALQPTNIKPASSGRCMCVAVDDGIDVSAAADEAEPPERRLCGADGDRAGFLHHRE